VCWCLRVTTLHVSLFIYGTRDIVTQCRRPRQYLYRGHFPFTSESAVEAPLPRKLFLVRISSALVSVYPSRLRTSHPIPLTSSTRYVGSPGSRSSHPGRTWSPSHARSRQVLDRLLEVVCGSSMTTATTSARRKISLWDLPHACQLPSSNSRHFRVPKVSVLAHARKKTQR
jgi:hypothetical protein